ERAGSAIDECRQCLAIRHVAERRFQLRIAGLELIECVAVDVADVNERAFAQEGARNLAPDAGGTRGDDDTQTLDAQIHTFALSQLWVRPWPQRGREFAALARVSPPDRQAPL